MSGLPAGTVKLDDGTGTFPHDISAYVEIGPDAGPISIVRGRGDELDSIQPSALSLTLNNTDGRFTLGSTSGGYGAITTDRAIRVTYSQGATTSIRFTGYVQTWPTRWPGGSSARSISTITATDRLARLARRNLRSSLEHEILADSPRALYCLDEPEGSATAGDTSGNGQPPLIPALTVGAAYLVPTFGMENGLTYSGTGAEFDAELMIAAPQVLPSGTQTKFWMEACIFGLQTTSDLTITGPCGTLRFTGGNAEATIGLTAVVGPSPGSLTGDVPHHVLVTSEQGVGTYLYVDGSLVDSDAGQPVTLTVTQDFSIRGNGLPNVVSKAAYGFSLIDATRASVHAHAALYGRSLQSSSDRLTSIASYTGIASGDLALESPRLPAMPAQDIPGNPAADAMATIAEAEGGLIFARGDGKLVMQNRAHRRAQTSPAWTVTSADVRQDADVAGDMQKIANYATGNRPNGASQVATNDDSIDAHGHYPKSLNLHVTTDPEVRDAIDWLVGTHAEPEARMPALTIDLMAAAQATQEAWLDVELSDRIQVTSLPTQAPSSTADLIVEGWTETIGVDEWTVTLNTSPWSVEAVFTLDDGTLGQLDAGNRLGY